MNILITGGTGFIGSRLALKCASLGYDVKVLGQENTEAEKENSSLLNKNNVKVILGSVLDTDIFTAALNGVDIVFHLAAAQHEMNVPDQRFWDVNVTGTKNIIEASIKAGVKRFVHGSTIGVYGSMDGLIDENSPCNPTNIYGKTKLEGEKLVLSYSEKIPVTVIRIPETYGPGDRRLLKLFKGIQKKVFFVIGKGKNYHHLIFVDDLINGFLLASEKPEAAGKVFLLAGPVPLTTNEMVSTIAESLGVKLPKFKIPLTPMLITATCMEKTLRPLGIQPPLHRRRMDFFVKSFTLSYEKAKKELGFNPGYSFSMGINETRDWYKESGLI